MTVLLSDQIKRLVEEGFLITKETFTPGSLAPASYDLLLGDEYFKNNRVGYLTDDQPNLAIGPHELVYVSTFERFRMPTNVVARYDIRVSLCHDGIGLQTGLQIDPSFEGKIFSPLFNFSDKEVTLQYMHHFASIEFSYTTEPTDESLKFTGEHQNISYLRQALPPGTHKSGLETLVTLEDNLFKVTAKFDKEITRMHARVDTMVGAVFQGMAFMIAALGILVAAISIVIIPEFKVGVPTDMSRIITIGIGVAIFIVVALVISLLIRRTTRKISGDTKISKG